MEDNGQGFEPDDEDLKTHTTLKNIQQRLKIFLTDLHNSAVDWQKLDAEIFGDSAIKKSREPLQHQIYAITRRSNFY